MLRIGVYIFLVYFILYMLYAYSILYIVQNDENYGYRQFMLTKRSSLYRGKYYTISGKYTYIYF